MMNMSKSQVIFNQFEHMKPKDFILKDTTHSMLSQVYFTYRLLGFPKVFNGSEIHSCFRWYMLVIRLRTLSESTLIVFDL